MTRSPSAWRNLRPYSGGETRFAYCLRMAVEAIALAVGLWALVTVLAAISPERIVG